MVESDTDELEFPAEARTRLTRKKLPLIQHVTFAHFNEFIRACVRGDARLQHLTPMNINFSAKVCYERFQHCSNEDGDVSASSSTSEPAPKRALWRVLLASFHNFVVWILIVQFGLCVTFAGPAFVVKKIIGSAESGRFTGYLWAMLLACLTGGYAIFNNHNHYRMYYGALQQRAALLTALYDKCLHVHPDARQRYGAGDILNLASCDVAQVCLFTQYCGLAVGIPIRACISCLMVYSLLGPGAYGAAGCILVMMPISFYVAYRLQMINRECMAVKDKRMDLTSELLGSIKIVKLFAWEEAFLNRITEVRKAESKILKRFLYGESAAMLIWNSSPFVVAFATYTCFLLLDRNGILRADAAFTAILVFGILRFYFIYLPAVLTKLVQARVALQRIEGFLNCDDLPERSEDFVEDDDVMIDMRKATFSWGEEVALRDIDLKIKRGELIAVLGQIGTGKSSLLSAMLGEMNRISGTMSIRDVKIAYVPQQAWIQSGTVRQNILFRNHLDKQYYSKVIKNCALRSDIRLLVDGDQTEVGDRGMNLSGGQKQRISIARAVYHQAELYFFDDPLSALDAHVSDVIFRDVMSNKGMLRHTTRIIATHNESILPMCSRVIVLDRGTITASGSFDEIANILNMRRRASITPRESDDGPKSTIMLTFLKTPLSVSPAEEDMDFKFNIEDEVKRGGQITWSVYATMAGHFGAKPLGVVAAMYILFRVMDIWSVVWIRQWTGGIEDLIKRNRTSGLSGNFRQLYRDEAIRGLLIFLLIGLGAAMATLIGFIVLATSCKRVSMELHETMLKSVLHAPLSFFDLTPVGRIMNRFSKDVTVMDMELYQVFDDYLGFLLAILGCVILIYVELHVMIVALIPAVLVFIYIRHIYLEAARQSKRLMLMCRSPVLNDFAEALAGVSVIRAFKAQHMLLTRNHLRVDVSQNTFFHYLITVRWAAIRVDALNSMFVFLMSTIILMNGSRLGTGTAGLLISYTMTVTRFMARFIESSTLLESALVSAERIFEYGELPSEASWEGDSEPPPADWPQQGVVRFVNYSCRYREGTPLVLNNLNLHIHAGQKVGVVGRTGAGKSSLTLALFRVIEPAKGQIFIDGVDLSTLGLHVLRKRLTMIPQEPMLFRGTLRSNLDPDDEFTDDVVEKAARDAHLRSDLTLSSEISEEGTNISLGERQLVCLGRALLRRSKILILDEATAAVDMATDNLIQGTIREAFASSTVITIAHRLSTILDYDMVIVMSAGEIIEKGPPKELMNDTHSAFHSMARDAGLVGRRSSTSV